jgi:hypothetical protein
LNALTDQAAMTPNSSKAKTAEDNAPCTIEKTANLGASSRGLGTETFEMLEETNVLALSMEIERKFPIYR